MDNWVRSRKVVDCSHLTRPNFLVLFAHWGGQLTTPLPIHTPVNVESRWPVTVLVLINS